MRIYHYQSSVSNLWFLIDTSESVRNDAIAKVYGEISGYIPQIDNLEGKLSFFDTEITVPIDFTSDDELLPIKPKGCGGTSFKAFFKHLKDKFTPYKYLEAITILTDGMLISRMRPQL